MDVFLADMLVVFASAVVLGILLRLFKLPSLVGQVLAGFVVGAAGLLSHESLEPLKLFSTLGVTLLLFLVGLEMNWKEVRNSGKTVFKLFFLQTGLLLLLFWSYSFLFLKLSLIPSLMLSMALTFSSTILVVKTLSEGRDLGSFVGKLSLGMLLLQDLLAILLLVLLPGFVEGFSWVSLGILGMKLVTIFIVINVLGHVVISWFMKKVIKNTEDLILFSLVWFFGAVYFSTRILQLSPEVGGILAGISLSTTWGHFQIVSKVRTLRDIFLTIFFVLLGLEVGSGDVNWWLVSQIVLLAIVGKFVVTWVVSTWFKLKNRTAFVLSANMTQISEFGLIVLAIGLKSALWDGVLVSAVTVAGLISMVLSTVFMANSRSLYRWLSIKLPRYFSRRQTEGGLEELRDHVILLGGDRTGRSILSFLKKNGEKVLVVDFNPEIVKGLKDKGEEVVFADAADPDIVELTNMSAAKMIISTVKDINDSLALLEEIQTKMIKVPIIVDAETASQAAVLYEAGASYVIFPHFVSGLHMGQLMKRFEKDSGALKMYRSKQNLALREIYEGEY